MPARRGPARVGVTGLPLLLTGALLVLAAGTTLLVRDDLRVEELTGAMLLMGGGLVMIGAWTALEIRTGSDEDGEPPDR